MGLEKKTKMTDGKEDPQKEETQESKEVPKEPRSERPPLESVIGSIAMAFDKKLSSGDIADLRRMDPNDPSCPAYWRIMSLYVASCGYVPKAEPLRIKVENQWAAILASMAKAAGVKGFHSLKKRTGNVLADMGFAEARLIRLIRSTDEKLPVILRHTAAYLASKGESCNWCEFARLVLYQRGDFAAVVRRRISRDYYNRENQQKQA